jgi:hypothetical protein
MENKMNSKRSNRFRLMAEKFRAKPTEIAEASNGKLTRNQVCSAYYRSSSPRVETALELVKALQRIARDRADAWPAPIEPVTIELDALWPTDCALDYLFVGDNS